jgi:hypothetical protein
MKRSAGTRPQRKAIRELGKRGIQGGNTLGEAKPAGEEAFYYFLRLVLVNFHRRLGVTRQNGTSSHHVVPPMSSHHCLSTTQVVKEIHPHGDEKQEQQNEQHHRQGGRLLRHLQIISQPNPALSHRRYGALWSVRIKTTC